MDKGREDRCLGEMMKLSWVAGRFRLLFAETSHRFGSVDLFYLNWALEVSFLYSIITGS